MSTWHTCLKCGETVESLCACDCEPVTLTLPAVFVSTDYARAIDSDAARLRAVARDTMLFAIIFLTET